MTKREMIEDSIRELMATRRDVVRDCGNSYHKIREAEAAHKINIETLRDVDEMTWRLREMLARTTD